MSALTIHMCENCSDLGFPAILAGGCKMEGRYKYVRALAHHAEESTFSKVGMAERKSRPILSVLYTLGKLLAPTDFFHRRLFSCCSQWSCESVDIAQPHDLFTQGLPRIWPSESSIPEDSFTYGLVNQYTRRRLTFSTDILNAFAGVIHAFESLPSPVGNHWGIPMHSDWPGLLTRFCFGLSWQFDWPATNTMERREGFPSWSWAGWIGPIEYAYEYASRLNKYALPPELCIEIELSDGSSRPLVEVYAVWTRTQDRLHITKFVKIEAWTMPVRLQMDAGLQASNGPTAAIVVIGPEGHNLQFQAQANFDCCDPQTPREERLFKVYDCVGVALGWTDDWENTFGNPVLILREKDTFWERVGISH